MRGDVMHCMIADFMSHLTNVVPCLQLGDGSTIDRLAPPSSDAVTGAHALAAGERHTCVIMQATGGTRCWGHNGYGQVQTGAVHELSTRHNRCRVQFLTVRFCVDSQLGDGTLTNRETASVPDVLTDTTAIAAGLHTCALQSINHDGGLRCWGFNADGQVSILVQVHRLTVVL